MAEQHMLTPQGRDKLHQELEELRAERRPEIVKRIHEAMEFGGDLSDMGEYNEAKQEQAFVEGRIIEIEHILREAVVAEHQASTEVDLGATVIVSDENGSNETYTIVGAAEADPMESRISNESPVGRALMGHRVGDKVTVEVPAGTLTYTIQEVT
jgi:transcription elongation factor GreA